jgi:hypothetical protein
MPGKSVLLAFGSLRKPKAVLEWTALDMNGQKAEPRTTRNQSARSDATMVDEVAVSMSYVKVDAIVE